MAEDQEYILRQILSIIEQENTDGVMIAGDVYDKSIPSAEAVMLFDDFLVQLAERKQKVFVISGNHDSPERIAFGSRIMDAGGIFLSPVFHDKVTPIRIKDEYGWVDFYLLPFIKPSHVRRIHENESINTFTDAIRLVIEDMKIDNSHRNILVSHQFVTGSKRCDSEEKTLGGSDNVDASVFAPFDYVALGHIHSPQSCGAPQIRYCGTPLKYSFSEARDHKSVTIVELREKGSINLKTVDLVPLHDLVELRGTYEELTRKSFYADTTWQEDYIHITLTDEEDVPDAIGKLRTIYHRLMKLDYDNMRTRSNAVVFANAQPDQKSPFTLFADFYQLQNNHPMSDEQSAYMQRLIEKVWEGEV